jgi:hypothetical protein
MRGYRFLIDNDSQSASMHFPGKRVVTLTQAGLSQAASDSEVVAAAREMGCIIVTANGPDFEREIKHFLQKSQRKDCYDLYGLVVIPNAAAIPTRALKGLSAKLRIDGKPISWENVWRENYLVRVHSDGSVDVRELGRCFYCKKLKEEEQ